MHVHLSSNTTPTTDNDTDTRSKQDAAAYLACVYPHIFVGPFYASLFLPPLTNSLKGTGQTSTYPHLLQPEYETRSGPKLVASGYRTS